MLGQTIAKRAFSTTARRANLARFTAIGRIGSPLEPTQSAAGTQYLRYSLAVNGPQQDQVSWYNVVVFDERAINVLTSYYQKGNRVFVEADASINVYGEGEQRRTTLNLVQRDVRKIADARRPDAEEGAAGSE